MHPYSFITFPLDCELCESRTFANVCVCKCMSISGCCANTDAKDENMVCGECDCLRLYSFCASAVHLIVFSVVSKQHMLFGARSLPSICYRSVRFFCSNNRVGWKMCYTLNRSAVRSLIDLLPFPCRALFVYVLRVPTAYCIACAYAM